VTVAASTLGPGGGQGIVVRRFRQSRWAVIDQAVSSAGNFGLTLIVARHLAAADFGAFAVTFALYTIGVGVVRAASSEPLALKRSLGEHEIGSAVAASGGLAVLLGCTFGLAVAAGSFLLFHGGIRPPLLALACSLPGLLLQDTLRLSLIISRHAHKAAANDTVWTLLALCAAGWVSGVGVNRAWVFVAVWGGAASVAALMGVVQTATVPRPTRAISWIRDQRRLLPSLVGEFLVLVGVGQTLPLVVAAVGGLNETAAFRGAQVLLGPPNVMLMGLMTYALAEANRRSAESYDAMILFVRRWALRVFIAFGLWAVLVLVLPATIGGALLGPTWGAAHAAVAGVALMLGLTAATRFASVALRVSGRAKSSFAIRSAHAPALLLAGLIGAVVSGAGGAAVAFAPIQAVMLNVMWRVIRRGHGERLEITMEAAWSRSS
jgi:O-antigen/teichoic acid export membrane protein